jgi:hypothetical protein
MGLNTKYSLPQGECHQYIEIKPVSDGLTAGYFSNPGFVGHIRKEGHGPAMTGSTRAQGLGYTSLSGASWT